MVQIRGKETQFSVPERLGLMVLTAIINQDRVFEWRIVLPVVLAMTSTEEESEGRQFVVVSFKIPGGEVGMWFTKQKDPRWHFKDEQWVVVRAIRHKDRGPHHTDTESQTWGAEELHNMSMDIPTFQEESIL
ncbi:MAG: hypothetical protein NUW02_00625 [Candidatus Campbellbacteria bacterium]|nr:hypothetical protein [Candidatus Campbellbacteria bacterium]